MTQETSYILGGLLIGVIILAVFFSKLFEIAKHLKEINDKLKKDNQ